uniref:Uncharacterized protein n=1 Tax=Anguilla anguilla TaxID=7936 RepID=A0A0E9WFQ9_ANGAN
MLFALLDKSSAPETTGGNGILLVQKPVILHEVSRVSGNYMASARQRAHWRESFRVSNSAQPSDLA